MTDKKKADVLLSAASILSNYQGSDAAEAVALLEDLAAQIELGVLTKSVRSDFKLARGFRFP